MSKPAEPDVRILLKPASWAQGSSFVTEGYIGENTPEMLERAGITLQSREGYTLDDDVEELFGRLDK